MARPKLKALIKFHEGITREEREAISRIMKESLSDCANAIEAGFRDKHSGPAWRKIVADAAAVLRHRHNSNEEKGE